jgi:GntR family transcriptional regulator
MDWTVDPDADVPPSRQLLEQILDAVASGRIEPGAQLPSVRAMAAKALVSHNTVQRTYLELERLGATEGVNGRGVFVTVQGPRVAAQQRRALTLAAARRAVSEALRAGHTYADLQSLLREEDLVRRSA